MKLSFNFNQSLNVPYIQRYLVQYRCVALEAAANNLQLVFLWLEMEQSCHYL